MNINKCVIEKIVDDALFGNVNCFLKLKDNKTILCGCDEGKFCFYNMNSGKYNTLKNFHDRNVYDLLKIDDNKVYPVLGIRQLNYGNIKKISISNIIYNFIS